MECDAAAQVPAPSDRLGEERPDGALLDLKEARRDSRGMACLHEWRNWQTQRT